MIDTTEQMLDFPYDAAIRRYLAGRMDTAEKVHFEVRMLEEPELLERVQLLEALQAELAVEEAALLAADTGAQDFKVLPFRYQLRQPLALAASVLVAVLGVHALTSAPDASGPLSPSGAVPVASLLLLETRRDETVPAFTGAGPYLLQIDAGLDVQADTVGLRLRDDASGDVLLEQQNLQVDPEGWVRLVYTQPLSGAYTIELGDSAVYRFSVQNP